MIRLSEAIGGPRIFIKRDDHTGLGMGGNKTRKLEYLLGDALAQGCDSVITAGAAQSNHCRQTAAAAAQLGLECHLVLGGEEPDQANGNLLLDQIFGCHFHWTGPNRKGEDIPAIRDRLLAKGKKPYIVPYGGSNELGAIAFMHAVEELVQQAGDMDFTHVVFASGSGGTHAGIMLGKHSTGSGFQALGINVDKLEAGEASLDRFILELANRTAGQLGWNHEFRRSDVQLNSDYTGAGYGVIGDLEKEAITLVARTEGILLDPVYTGRAMGGLLKLIKAGEISSDDRVLFWHTGGAPALFASPEALGGLSRRHS